jgi:hypothetical protein
MSKWANNDAIVIAENLAKVAYQYYVFDDEDEAFDYYDFIACGTHPESTGCIYNDVLFEFDCITDFAEDHQLKLDDESKRLLYEALDLASAYDGPIARGLEA